MIAPRMTATGLCLPSLEGLPLTVRMRSHLGARSVARPCEGRVRSRFLPSRRSARSGRRYPGVGRAFSLARHHRIFPRRRTPQSPRNPNTTNSRCSESATSRAKGPWHSGDGARRRFEFMFVLYPFTAAETPRLFAHHQAVPSSCEWFVLRATLLHRDAAARHLRPTFLHELASPSKPTRMKLAPRQQQKGLAPRHTALPSSRRTDSDGRAACKRGEKGLCPAGGHTAQRIDRTWPMIGRPRSATCARPTSSTSRHAPASQELALAVLVLLNIQHPLPNLLDMAPNPKDQKSSRGSKGKAPTYCEEGGSVLNSPAGASPRARRLISQSCLRLSLTVPCASLDQTCRHLTSRAPTSSQRQNSRTTAGWCSTCASLSSCPTSRRATPMTSRSRS